MSFRNLAGMSKANANITVALGYSITAPSYRINLNFGTKVLDVVQFGGPDLTVGGTVFDLVMDL